MLEAYPPDLSASAARALARLGVQVRTGSGVTAVSATEVRLSDEVIPACTTLWAAGVAASPLGRRLARQLGLEVDRNGRVPVLPDLTLPGHPEVYVIGDLAALEHVNGKLLPGIAPVAIQEGDQAAENIWRSIRDQPRRAFHYFDRGNMATIGRAAAVAQVRALHLSGLVAWLAWLAVHVLFLIGFENRMLVVLSWAWSYLSNGRGARLITSPWPGGAAVPASPAPHPETDVTLVPGSLDLVTVARVPALASTEDYPPIPLSKRRSGRDRTN